MTDLDDHDAYYGYTPTVILDRPLALTGFVGSGIADVAGALSQRTGLSLIEVPRWVEHEAGKSLSHLALTEGEGRVRALEREAVGRALRDRPLGILVLGDASLLDEPIRAQLLKQATVVYIARDLETLIAGVREELARAPGSVRELMHLSHVEDAAIAGLFEERRGSYERAHVTIDAGRRAPTAIAEELLIALRHGTLSSTKNA